MSEPRRWKDSADAPLGMRELLASAQRSRPLDERAFRRGQSRVARLGVVPAAAAAVSVWVKLAAAGAIGLAATTAVVVESGWRPFEPPPAPAAAPVRAPVRTSAAPTNVAVEPVVVVEPVMETIEPAPIVATPTPKVTAPKIAVAETPRAQAATADAPVWTPPDPPRTKSSLADELPLLEDARRLLAQSPATALERLQAHRARYPFGVLATERDLMELDALRRTGRVQDAHDRAQAWLEREPNGIHATRLRAILASLDATPR